MKKILSGLFIGFLFSTAVFAFSVNEMGKDKFFEAIYLVAHNGVSSDFVVGVEGNSKESKEIVVEKSVPSTDISEVNINTSVTDLIIKEDDTIDEIMIKQVINYRSTFDFEPELVNVENRNGKIYIELEKKNFTNMVSRYDGNLYITIPKGLLVSFTINSSVGDVNLDIEEIKDNVKINNSVGNVTVESNMLTDDLILSVNSSVGDIEIDINGVGENTTIDIENSVGDVDINRNIITKDMYINVETSIGDLKVSNLDEIKENSDSYKAELDKLNQFLIVEPVNEKSTLKITNSTGDIKLK